MAYNSLFNVQHVKKSIIQFLGHLEKCQNIRDN
jgi:hypothetical protein